MSLHILHDTGWRSILAIHPVQQCLGQNWFQVIELKAHNFSAIFYLSDSFLEVQM